MQRDDPMGGRSGYAALALFLLILAVFWQTLFSFHAKWSESTSGYGHGYLVVAIVAYLAWRDRAQLFGSPRSNLLVLPLLLLASLLWFAGRLLTADLVAQGALLLVVCGWAWIVFGWRAVLRAAPLIAMLLLTLSVWDVANEPLRLMTAAVSGSLVRSSGIVAYIEEASIHLPSGSLVVAAGCSGLSYLLVSLFMGVLYGYLYLRTARMKVLMLIIAVAMGLLSNWIRVTGLIVIGYVSEMQSPLIADHELYGWVIFAVALWPFFMLGARLEAIEGKAASIDSAPAEEPLRSAPRRAPMVLATVVALLGPALMLVRADADAAPGAFSDLGLPAERVFDATSIWWPDFPGADLRDARSLGDRDPPVVLHRIAYVRQSQGKELVNALNRIVPTDRILRQALPDERTGELEAIIDGRTWYVRYWYEVAGRRTSSQTRAKLLEIPAWIERHEMSGLVVLSSRCEAIDCEAASARVAQQLEDLPDQILGASLD